MFKRIIPLCLCALLLFLPLFVTSVSAADYELVGSESLAVNSTVSVVDGIQAVLPAEAPAIPELDLVKYPCLLVQSIGSSYRIDLWTSSNYFRGSPFLGRTTYLLGTKDGDTEPDGIYYFWTVGSGSWELYEKPDNLGIGYFSGSPEVYKPDDSVSRILYSTFTIYHYDGSVCHESDMQQVVPDTPNVVYPSRAEEPKFRKMPNGATYYYSQGVVADPLVVDAYVSDGGDLSYEWYGVHTVKSVATGSAFVPPTDEVGEFRWYCKVTNKVYNPNVDGGYLYWSRYTYTDTVVVVPPGEVVPPDTPGTPDYTDTLNGIQDSLNATNPGLDSAIGGFENSSSNVGSFEDEQWSGISDNIDTVTGQFDVFGAGSSMLSSFQFLSGIVNNTYNSLGPWQVVIVLPVCVGLILFICSRAPLNTIPRAHRRADREAAKATKSKGNTGKTTGGGS